MRKLLTCLSCLSIALGGCADEEPGRIRMTLVDAPADFDAVNIAVTTVEAHQAGADDNSGWINIASAPGVYDLLTLRNGLSALIADNDLPAGHYTQIRLFIGTGSNVVVDGVGYPLEIPSGVQSGVKLNHQFTIDPGVAYDLTLDFDADRSVVLTASGEYQLNPVIRLQADESSGSISGTIVSAEAHRSAWTVVATDTVSAVADEVTGYFKLMAIPAGTYAVTVVAGSHDTLIEGVIVSQGRNTDIGSIILSP